MMTAKKLSKKAKKNLVLYIATEIINDDRKQDNYVLPLTKWSKENEVNFSKYINEQ